MRLPIASLIVLASVAAADTSSWVFWELWSYHSGQASSLGLSKFTSLVTFGDSYTDDSRLNYFSLHNGDAPPVGWVDPAVRLSGFQGHGGPPRTPTHTVTDAAGRITTPLTAAVSGRNMWLNTRT